MANKLLHIVSMGLANVKVDDGLLWVGHADKHILVAFGE